MLQNPSWETNQFSASQEIPPFYGTHSFIAAFTSACHLPLSSAHTSGSIQVWGTCLYFITWYIFTVRSCSHLTQPLSWSTIPWRLSATAYSIYSQLPSILEAVPPSATWGLAMPWWQGPTYHQLISKQNFHLCSYVSVRCVINFKVAAIKMVHTHDFNPLNTELNPICQ